MAKKIERRKMIQQGDVLLIPVATPSAAEMKQAGVTRKHQERITLALGEVTGHSHVMEDVDVLEGLFGKEVVIVADEPKELKHVIAETGEPTGEHPSHTTETGSYLVRLQRKYVAPVRSRPAPARMSWADD